MIALFIGIFAGFFSFFLIDKTVLLVRQCILVGGFSSGFRAAAGSIAVQILWTVVLAVSLGLMSHYLKTGNHINSIRGYDNSFVMLSALILGFSAYRLLRKPVLLTDNHHVITQGKEFYSLFNASFLQPERILIYLALFGLWGIHSVTGTLFSLFFLVLGTTFGVFLWWSLFCGLVSQDRAESTTAHLFKYSRAGAGFILVLAAIGLVFVALIH